LAPAIGWSLYLLVVGYVFGYSSPVVGAAQIFVYVAVVAYAHAIALGIPVSLLIGRRSWLDRPRIVLVAALIGAVPVAVWLTYGAIGDSSSSFTWNGTVLINKGELTRAGWMNRIVDTLQFAASGAIAGLAWCWISGEPQRPRANASAI
jgi:hypothetical protein